MTWLAPRKVTYVPGRAHCFKNGKSLCQRWVSSKEWKPRTVEMRCECCIRREGK